MAKATSGRIASATDEQVKPVRLSSPDHVVREIVRGIYDGRYVAGQRLVETDLMQEYGVSRSTVRETLKRLTAEGVLVSHPFRGAQVRQLSSDEVRNILLILELLIGLAAKQAAGQAALGKPVAAFKEALVHLLEFEHRQASHDLVRARNRFYRAMTDLAGNQELMRIVKSIHVLSVRTYLNLSDAERFADYRAIGNAITTGDAETAEQVARQHIRRTMETLRSVPSSNHDDMDY